MSVQTSLRDRRLKPLGVPLAFSQFPDGKRVEAVRSVVSSCFRPALPGYPHFARSHLAPGTSAPLASRTVPSIVAVGQLSDNYSCGDYQGDKNLRTISVSWISRLRYPNYSAWRIQTLIVAFSLEIPFSPEPRRRLLRVRRFSTSNASLPLWMQYTIAIADVGAGRVVHGLMNPGTYVPASSIGVLFEN